MIILANILVTRKPTYAGKNQVYILDKLDKVRTEIKLIMHGKIMQSNLMYLGFQNKHQAYGIKKYQLEILDIIRASEVADLVAIKERKTKLMCKQCQDGLKNGDLGCRKDLKTFIFADMIRRSLL